MGFTQEFKVLPFPVRCTIILFVAAGLAALASAASFQNDIASGRLLVLLIISIPAARVKVKLLKGATLSLLTCVVLLAIITEGPAVSLLVGLCGVTVQTLLPAKKLVLHQLAFNNGMIAVTVSGSWWTYHLLAKGQNGDTIWTDLVAVLFASFMYFLGNSISVSVIVGLSKGLSAFHVWYRHFLVSAPSFLIAGLIALGALGMLSSEKNLIPTLLLNALLVAYYYSVRVTGFNRR